MCVIHNGLAEPERAKRERESAVGSRILHSACIIKRPLSPSTVGGFSVCEKGGNNQITLGRNIVEKGGGDGNPPKHKREKRSSPKIMADPLQEIGVVGIPAQTRNTRT